MSDNTDKFNPINSGGGIGGTTDAVPQRNFLGGAFNIIDGNGKVLASQEVDATRQAFYSRSLTADDIGIKTLQARYTGDAQFAPAKQLGDFTMHVSDANGNNGTASGRGTVDQIVAGPGVYISSPNGQGVVTIGLTPLSTTVNTNTLFDIAWTTVTGDTSYGSVGQFTAVGVGGTNMRSRDGHNWIQMTPGTEIPILGVSAEQNANIPGGIEYNGVSTQGRSVYGHLGANGDAMTTISQLSDQNGPITENLLSTFIWQPFGSGSGSGGGGSTGTTSTTSTSAIDVIAYDPSNLTDGSLQFNTGVGVSSDMYVQIRIHDDGQSHPASYFYWSNAFGLDNATYGPGGAHANLPVYWSVSFNTYLLPQAGGPSFAIGDSNITQELGVFLTNPLNTIPQMPSFLGVLYDVNLQQYGINSAGQPNTVKVTLSFTDANGQDHTLVMNGTATWN
jgi:hypothetical protein